MISVAHLLTESPSQKMTTLCAWPVRTVMFRPICAYCGKPESFYAHCDYRLAILACDDPEHQLLAERDAKSWLHKNGRVRPNDYKQDPLFQETDLLTMDVHVLRSDGSIDTEGWKIRNPSFADHALAKFGGTEGNWHIPVLNKLFDKYIRIQDIKRSLPEEKHALVDAFEAKLTHGFYLAESLAYDEAKRLQEENNNPVASSDKPSMEYSIESCIHPIYGIGRVFMPNKPELVQEQGDPST